MTARYKDWLADSYLKEMSNQHSVQALSWRRFYLARAKLKASSRTSALLSGFAMVAMVEAQLSDDLPFGLLIIFSICTTLVVAIHLLALMISTCVLPNMEAVSNVHNVTAVLESPHEKMHWYIELAWIFSTGVGILLFLVEMCILAWVRFLPSNSNCCEGSGEGATAASPSKWRYAAPISSTIIIVPCLFIFIVFAIRFYRQLITHKYERHTQGLEELENMASELNASNVQAPLNSHNMQIV